MPATHEAPMRKIEKEMLAAIRKRRNWKKANTRVEIEAVDRNEVRVYLYNHMIAEICLDDKGNVLGLSDCGYRTATTKSRLNVLIKELVGVQCDILQKAGAWFYRKDESIVDWRGESRNWIDRNGLQSA